MKLTIQPSDTGGIIRVTQDVKPTRSFPNSPDSARGANASENLAAPAQIKTAPRNRSLKILNIEDSVAAYLDSIRNSKKLSLAEERDLSMRIQAGDKKALNILVTANLKFVVSVCRNYRNQGLPFGDLINEGNLGLIRAAQRFDSGKDCRFITYAVWWIRQGLVVALSEQTRFLKVAPGRVQAMRKIAQAGKLLEHKLGRAPRTDELAAETGLTADKIVEYMQLAVKAVSLNAPAPDGGAGLEDSLEDRDGERTDASTMAMLTRKRMSGLLGSLDERKAMILRLHYGIDSEFAMPLSDIASKLNLTRERVRQIKARALAMLRHPAKLKRAFGFTV